MTRQRTQFQTLGGQTLRVRAMPKGLGAVPGRGMCACRGGVLTCAVPATIHDVSTVSRTSAAHIAAASNTPLRAATCKNMNTSSLWLAGQSRPVSRFSDVGSEPVFI